MYSEFVFEVLKVTDMEKTILTIAFSILAIYTFAQRAQLGVQASPLFSIASYDGESQNGIGYTAGLSCKLPLGGNWSIRPEFNIQQRSLTETAEENYSNDNYSYSSTYKSNFKLTFIDIPVLFEYRNSSKLGFYVGPQFGTDIGLKNQIDYEYSEIDLETGEECSGESSESETYTEWSLSELSLALGANYNLDNGLSFEFRFQRYLALIEDGDIDTDFAFAGIQLGCRYLLPLGK